MFCHKNWSWFDFLKVTLVDFMSETKIDCCCNACHCCSSSFLFFFFHIYFEEMINDTFKVICGINFRNFGERLKLFDYFHLFAFSISFSHSMRNSTIYMIDLKEQTVWILHVYCSYLTLHHFPHSSSLFPFFSSHSHP